MPSTGYVSVTPLSGVKAEGFPSWEGQGEGSEKNIRAGH